MVLRGGRRGVGRAQREEIRARRRADRRAPARRRALQPAGGADRRPARSTPPSRRCARQLRRGPRRLRRRAEVPAGLGDRAPAAPRRDRDGARHAARDGVAAASTTRSAAASPATRSTPPGRSRTSRRCSTTTRCSRAPTCTAGRSRRRRCCGASARRRSTGCCARCAAPRAASPRALDADSEGVEGKFYVWTLDELRAALGDLTPTPRSPGSAPPSAGNFEGAQHPRGARARAAASARARSAARLLAARERARAAGPRRQAPDRPGTR